MAAKSAVAAAMTLYDTLTAANFPNATRPGIFLGEAPVYDGGQLRPPYVVLKDSGDTTEWDFEVDGLTSGGFTLEVYYNSLADCDTAMQAILWNGQNPNLKAGLAFATLSLAAPLYPMKIVPGKSTPRTYAGIDYAGQRVHTFGQEFLTEVLTKGSG